MTEIFGTETPRLWTKPLRALTPETSHGFHVVEFASEWLGIQLFPWQQWLLIHALELNEDGTYRFRKVFVIVGRQNGKTTLLTVLSLWWLFVDADAFAEHLPADEFLVLGVAQNLDIAEDAWGEALKRCDPKPDPDMARFAVPVLQQQTRPAVKVNGKKLLRLRSGAEYAPRAASRGAGRGKTAARVIMDEMREQRTWDVWGSVSKTKNAVYNSQLWGISSAGDVRSIVLKTLRVGQEKAIRAWDDYVATGVQSVEDYANQYDLATALFEWSAAPADDGGDDLLDLEGILQANPSVGHKPMFLQSILSDLRGDEPESVKRTEILCQWVSSLLDVYLDVPRWGELLDAQSHLAASTRAVLGVHTSGDRSHVTSIGVAGLRPDGFTHLEVIAQRPGMLWVVDHLVKVRAKTGINEVALQGRGCAASDFAKPLEEAGFIVHRIEGTQLLNAAGRLSDRMREGRVRHRGQAPLNLAVANATTKQIQGMPVWDLHGSPIDIAPVVSVDYALYALETASPPAKKKLAPPPLPAEIITRDDVAEHEENLAFAPF